MYKNVISYSLFVKDLMQYHIHQLIFLSFMYWFLERERRGGMREKNIDFFVPPINAFIDWFLHEPRQGIKPTTLAYRQGNHKLIFILFCSKLQIIWVLKVEANPVSYFMTYV